MKNCLFTISLPASPEKSRRNADAADLAAQYGYAGLETFACGELAGGSIDAARSLRETCAHLGLSIPCHTCGGNLAKGDGREALQRIKTQAAVAAALGAPLLHHTLIPPLTPDNLPIFHHALPRLVELCREIAYAAGELSLTVVYENQGLVCNGAERMEEFLCALDMPNTGLVLDTGNCAFADEPPCVMAARLSSRILHCHIKDYRMLPANTPYPGNGWRITLGGRFIRDTVIGRGQTDLLTALRALHCSHYEGWFSTEYEGDEGLEAGLSEGLKTQRILYARAAEM